MIAFHAEIDFKLENANEYTEWIIRLIESEGAVPGDINFVFLDDEALREINIKYLSHDYFTDIITFPLGEGPAIDADILMSVERISENADTYNVPFDEELRRVMAHGILHLMGWDDKTEADQVEMRRKEEQAIELFHVKQ